MVAKTHDRPRPLSRDEQLFLLRLARSTLQERFAGRTLPGSPPPPGPLTEPRGAFVTLTIDRRLRGCIGHVVGVEPLWRAVRDNAIAVAFHDPRFPQLEEHELEATALEISALSPLFDARSPQDVEIGRHGVMIELGPARGLLLPQVASEHGWDRETFLDHTCRKAGLDPGCWREPHARLQLFTAEVFSERDLGLR